MFDFKLSTVRLNNYDLSYVEAGQGEPLVFLHGSLLRFPLLDSADARLLHHLRQPAPLYEAVLRFLQER
ncbi:MAG: hypothetical protein QOG66_2665 [Methylobacteriaceae bacterium]|jgi:pimeloyl-ACP methyl ester carboxylesterase|nr:hypothetical protein [Methylobacteriaceae bacterium]